MRTNNDVRDDESIAGSETVSLGMSGSVASLDDIHAVEQAVEKMEIVDEEVCLASGFTDALRLSWKNDYRRNFPQKYACSACTRRILWTRIYHTWDTLTACLFRRKSIWSTFVD